jgi:hypothetical protein
VSTPESITQFLTLPTITTRANPRRRLTNPVVDFTKSVMLTSCVYLDAVQQVHEKKKLKIARDKERSRTQKAKSKGKKVLEQEEEKRQREARAVEMEEIRAAKALQRQKVARVKVLERTEAERKKAKRAFFQAQQQLLSIGRALRKASQQNLVSTAAEMVVGWQAGSVPSQSSEVPIGSTSSTDIHVQEQRHNFMFMNHQHLFLLSPIPPIWRPNTIYVVIAATNSESAPAWYAAIFLHVSSLTCQCTNLAFMAFVISNIA